MTLVIAGVKALGVILAACVIAVVILKALLTWLNLLVDGHTKSAMVMLFAVAWVLITYCFYV